MPCIICSALPHGIAANQRGYVGIEKTWTWMADQRAFEIIERNIVF